MDINQGFYLLAGGLVAWASKYIADQFIESKKLAMNIAARQREKYFEKQASALITVYELVKKASATNSKLTFLENYEDERMVKIEKDTHQKIYPSAKQAFEKLEDFIECNDLLFPFGVANLLALIAMDIYENMTNYDETVRSNFKELDQQILNKMYENRQNVIANQINLRKQLAELLRGRDSDLEPTIKRGVQGLPSRVKAAWKSFKNPTDSIKTGIK